MRSAKANNNNSKPSYLSGQELRLRSPTTFNFIADAVEERDTILLLIEPSEICKNLASLLCKKEKKKI